PAVVPPPGEAVPPPGDTKPPGQTKPPSGDVVPPAGDGEPPRSRTKPPAEDTEAPVMRTPPPITVDATDAHGAVVTFAVTATDGGLVLTPVCDPPSGRVFPVGTTRVSCRAADAAGNVSSIGFDVAVRPLPTPPTAGDTEPPDVRAPVATDDAVDTVAGVAVPVAFLANDIDPSGKADARVTAQPAHGSVEVLQGLLRYTPKAGFVGSDSLSYSLCRSDLPGRCDSATVTIHVHPAEGKAEVALATPVWQAVSQRTSESLPSGCKGAMAWGGFLNGHVPANQMVAISAGHVLESAAAAAFVEMRAAAERDGVRIPITDSYRSFGAQVELRSRKGAFVATATPGTSVHGWGKAVDIDLGSPALRPWLDRSAVRFGWVNPAWAKRPGMSLEPWHYEFYGSLPGTAGGDCAPVANTAGPAGVQAITLSRPSERPGSDVIVGTSASRPEGAESEPEDVGITRTSILSRDQAVPAVLGLLASAALAFGLRAFMARQLQRRRRKAEDPSPT
ncbi:MAG: Ig-like domain-containing protein, partial [Egibacteraceae bacterium]